MFELNDIVADPKSSDQILARTLERIRLELDLSHQAWCDYLHLTLREYGKVRRGRKPVSAMSLHYASEKTCFGPTRPDHRQHRLRRARAGALRQSQLSKSQIQNGCHEPEMHSDQHFQLHPEIFETLIFAYLLTVTFRFTKTSGATGLTHTANESISDS